ncbi:MAG TPA: tetratricopeptide repeat-containing glycosyltransferase family protein, partial [Usitatibacter sp.]|nr:tetratricopeptide repeat-containing glycosyltransferase family protein [Usitatibacter sp.]
LLGCIRAQSGARDEGLGFLDRALAIDPRNAAFLINRGRVRLEAGRSADAAGDLQLALQAMPKSAAAQAQVAFVHNMLGVALQREGRADEAIEHLGQALALAPSLTGALVNWGNALETRGDLEGARAKYREAIVRDASLSQAWLNAASVAVDLGRNDEAREAYARAMASNPSSADARYGLGLLDLREQRFGAGWDGYEYRFDTDPPQSTRRGPDLPPLEADDLGAGRRVAVWKEMGVGDQVLYSTLLPELRKQAAHVVAEVDPRLLRAYRRSLPGIEFVAKGDSFAFDDACDRQVGIGSLARLFRRDAASFSRQPQPLLRPEPARVEAIRAHLGDGRHIAISWRSLQGANRASRAARKSIALAQFAPMAREAGARLVDVQYGDVEAELAAFEREHPGVLVRIPGLDPFQDLEGVMATMVACGAVVTVSNAAAHLAGAIGVPTTLVFAGAVAPFHYWDAVAGGRSLWHPSITVVANASHIPSPRFDR